MSTSKMNSNEVIQSNIVEFLADGWSVLVLRDGMITLSLDTEPGYNPREIEIQLNGRTIFHKQDGEILINETEDLRAEDLQTWFSKIELLNAHTLN